MLGLFLFIPTLFSMQTKLTERITTYVVKAANQELVQKYLRSLRYEFFTFEQINLKLGKKPIETQHQRYQFMARPTVNKEKVIDTRLIVGIKIIGKLVDSIIIYRDYNFYMRIKKPWAKKAKNVNFKKITQKMKFPKELNYDQRKEWRREYEKLKRNPNYKPSQFFNKYKDLVTHLKN
jgi:tRNA U34 5-carboxymethylaminomethyl modifying enzyme MnmG/GidA